MHWSKSSVGGDIPTQGLKSHTATLVPQNSSCKFFVLGGNETATDAHLLTFDPGTYF